jgi:pimeloyl-ACP methyl ester carboxylesterase
MERFLTSGGRRIWAQRRGTGPSLILSSGAGHSGTEAFDQIAGPLSEFATVVTYDRAGLGRSDPAATSPTAEDMTDDLEAVISALDIRAPLFLCGVSLGALPIQLYATRRPRDVAGFLLLDPTPDEMVAGIADWPSGPQEIARKNLTAGAEITPQMAFEMELLVESSIQVRDAIAACGLPDVPLVIAALDRPHASVLSEHHSRMASRSSSGRVVTVDGTSHKSFVEDHSGLIVELARELLQC